MGTLRLLVGSIVVALMISAAAALGTPGAGGSGPAAAGVAEARSSPAQATSVSAARKSVKRMTPRERRLARLKPCSTRQWRRTPVRCNRIKAAKAKARALAAPVRRPAPAPAPAPLPGPAPGSPPTEPVPGPTPPTEGPSGDTEPFTVAVIPDTQNEVFGSDLRMRHRSEWLVEQQSALDLRFVNHIGDVVNWGWLEPQQLRIASDGLLPLERAGIPYSLSVGNHDTRAVGWNGQGGYGGGAYVQNPECRVRLGAEACRTELLVRQTQEFNDVFTAARFGAVRGAFESGKVDNVYSTFSAGGRSWMVLNLELWPRPEAVAWAGRVVTAHPGHNVIVSTHSYLDAAGGIYQRADYGSTSPQQVWDRFVSQHANIKIVLSGHTGTAAVRTDVGRAGNRVVSLMQTFHSAQGNPVRLLRIHPASGRLETWVTSPNGRGGDFSAHTRTIDGLDLVG